MTEGLPGDSRLFLSESKRIVLLMTSILRARQQVGIKQSDVAAAVGRSNYFMIRAEAGQQQLTPEEEAGILRAIKCLAAFERAVLLKRQEYLAGLKLPPTRTGTSRPSLPGN